MNTQNNLMGLASSSPFIREETVVHTVNGEAINGKFCLNAAAVLTFLGLKYKNRRVSCYSTRKHWWRLKSAIKAPIHMSISHSSLGSKPHGNQLLHWLNKHSLIKQDVFPVISFCWVLVAHSLWTVTSELHSSQ